MIAVRTLIRPRPLAGDRSRDGRKALRRAAHGLCLAAAPTFMLMALASLSSRGMPAMACAAMPDASPIGGMTTMYLLMGVFHLAPWLRLGSAETTSDEEGRAGRT